MATACLSLAVLVLKGLSSGKVQAARKLGQLGGTALFPEGFIQFEIGPRPEVGGVGSVLI